MRMLKDKKGVELTLNAVIIGVLVMIVLVVIVMIFTGVIGDIVPPLEGFMSCSGKGGQCADTCNPGEQKIYHFGECGDDSEPDYCCIPPEE